MHGNSNIKFNYSISALSLYRNTYNCKLCIGEHLMFVYGKSYWTAWPLNFEPIGCSKTSVTTCQRCVTSRKSENIIYAVAGVCNTHCSVPYNAVYSLIPSLIHSFIHSCFPHPCYVFLLSDKVVNTRKRWQNTRRISEILAGTCSAICGYLSTPEKHTTEWY